MTYGYTPGGDQDDHAGTPPPEYGGLPPYPGQAGAAGPPGWAAGQQVPPGWTPGQQVPPGYGPPQYGQGQPQYGPPQYGQPGYGPPGYGPPAYYPPGYGAPMYAPPGSQPPAYTGWAISALIGGVLFSLLVGLPAAITGQVYGSKVSRLWASGDVQGAHRASRRARGWLTASTVFDLLGLVLVAFIIVTHVSSAGVSFTHTSVAPASVSVLPAQQTVQTGTMSGMMSGCHGHMGMP
ncbi:MAG TPA: CD225/dispanin family protein [Streptosporangiaceae bacterium]|nr:CD225/dispanin family protein [Streptosporangiaceae bacterium]